MTVKNGPITSTTKRIFKMIEIILLAYIVVMLSVLLYNDVERDSPSKKVSSPLPPSVTIPQEEEEKEIIPATVTVWNDAALVRRDREKEFNKIREKHNGG